jgi:hypothetical protein
MTIDGAATSHPKVEIGAAKPTVFLEKFATDLALLQHLARDQRRTAPEMWSSLVFRFTQAQDRIDR